MFRLLAGLLLVVDVAIAQPDPLPEHALTRLGTTRFRPGCRVDSLAFSPDGKEIASWGASSSFDYDQVTIWDAATGRAIRSIRGPRQSVQAFGWARGRTGLAVLTRARLKGRIEDRELITDLTVWDFTANRPVDLKKRELVDGPSEPAPTILDAIIESADGKRLAVATSVNNTPGPVVIYELKPANSLADLKRLAEFAAPPVLCRTLSFTPDGKWLIGACAADDAKAATLVVWDAAGKIVRTFDAPAGSGAGWVTATNTTAAVTLETGDVFLVGLDGRNGRTAPTAHKGDADGYGLLNFAFLPDGKGLVTTGRDGMIRLTDVATGKVTHAFGAHGFWPRALAVSPDGKRVAVSAVDGVIRVWDLTTGKDAVPTGGHQDQVYRVSMSTDCRVAVTAGVDRTIRVWDPATGTEKQKIEVGDPILDCRLAPDGKHVVAAVGPPDGPGRSLRTWDVSTGAEATSAWMPRVSAAGFRFTPDGKTMLTYADNHLAAWAWPAGTRLWAANTPAADNGINDLKSLAVSPDGRHFVSTTHFRSNRDMTQPQPPVRGGKFLDFWETTTGRRVRRLAEFEILPFRSAEFAADGTLAVSGYGALPNDTRDGRPVDVRGLCLIDPRTGRLVRKFATTRREHIVYDGKAIALSADGRVLFYGTGDGDIELYEVATGQLRAALRGHRGTIWAMDAPANDVRRMLSGSADTTALWWDVGIHGKPAILSAEDREGLWEDLTKKDAERGFKAMTKLAADPVGFVALAAKELQPAPPGPSEAVLARLFKDLDANSFAAREAAGKALDGYGERALPQAWARLDTPLSPEARERLTKFVERHTKPDGDPERLRQGRAVELLEHLGTPEAKELLAKLATGGPGKLTTQAVAAVSRLANR